jgi:hypothetical protein
MNLGLGHKVDVGADQASRFPQADPGRCCSYHCFGTRYIHELEKHPSPDGYFNFIARVSMISNDAQVFDDPLHNSELDKQSARGTSNRTLDAHIIHHLHECNEENGSGELYGAIE